MMDIKKTASVLTGLLLAAAIGMAGCAKQVAPAPPPEPAQKTEAQAVAFTDALGRSVTVENPKKVAAVNGSYAQVWLLAGGELVGATEDAWYERKLDLPEQTAHLGAMKSPSVEKLIELDVDFLLLSSKVAEHLALLETLEAAGIPCAYFEVETFEDYLSMLKICTDITGSPQMYQKNGEHVREQVAAAIARGENKPAPTVLFIRAFSTGAKAKGSDNMTGIMLKELGCVNIADSEESLLEDVSMEQVIAADPDFIFVVTMGESSEKALDALAESLTSNPAWAGLSAVKNDRFVVLPKELFHYKPNARWGESYEMLADILYKQEK